MTGLSPVGRVSCWYPVARFRRLKKFLRYRRGAQEISARSRCISRRLRNLILNRLIPAMLPLYPRSRKINLAGLSLSSPPKTSRAWPHHRVHPLRHDRSWAFAGLVGRINIVIDQAEASICRWISHAAKPEGGCGQEVGDGRGLDREMIKLIVR